ncbi:MAG: response regulator [Calditrichaceae bacterium]
MSKEYDILIIDDEQVIIDSVIKLCTNEGFSVDSSLDANEGLNKIAKNRYRLIICDIMLPEMDGFMFLDEIIPQNLDSPVIMTTGYSTVENAVKSLYTGAIDFLPKPFTVDELLSSVFRGLKYAEINKSLKHVNSVKNDASIIYIPCPAKYFRLGYGSWLYIEHDGSVLTGITDLLLRTVDSIDHIELLNMDEEIVQGNACAQLVTTDNLVHNILAPMTGRIIEINDHLLKDKQIIEKDPYFKGWFYRIIPSDLEYELKHLTPCSSDRI